jgi:hypothetical protein
MTAPAILQISLPLALPLLAHLSVSAAGPAAPAHPVAVLRGHADWVRSVAFTPDGKTLLSGGDDGTVRLWDPARRRQRAALKAPGAVSALACSADGKTLAFAGDGGYITVWDLEKGKRRARLRHPDPVLGLALSANGRTLAAGSLGAVRVWDLRAGKLRLNTGARAEERFPALGPVALSPDGVLLAAAERVDGVGVWEVPAAARRASYHEREHLTFVTALAFSPDGRLLAWGTNGGTVRLWEVAARRERTSLRAHPLLLSGLAFSPQGHTLATASYDRTVRLWDVLTGQRRTTLTGHADVVSSVAFRPDGKVLASAGADGTVRLWDVPPRPAPRRRRLDPGDLPRLWDALAGDAPTAFVALRRLAAAPDQAVPYLGKRLRPAAPSGKRLARWLTDLDSDEFADREAATREIARMGRLAEPALRKTLEEGPSLEVRRRVTRLLAQMEKGGLTGEQLRDLRAVEALEHAGTAEARRVLRRHATGDPDAPLTTQAKGALRRMEQTEAARPSPGRRIPPGASP